MTQNAGTTADTAAVLIIILGLYIIALHLGWLEIFQNIPTINEKQVSYFALFLIGLLTSVHCIAMCGGLNLAQSLSSGYTGRRRNVHVFLLYGYDSPCLSVRLRWDNCFNYRWRNTVRDDITPSQGQTRCPPSATAHKGSFNVRISPELYRQAAVYAITHNMSLNRFVETAIQNELVLTKD